MADNWMSVVWYVKAPKCVVTSYPGDPTYLRGRTDWLVHYADGPIFVRWIRFAPADEDPAIGCAEMQAALGPVEVQHAIIPKGGQFPVIPGDHPIFPHHAC